MRVGLAGLATAAASAPNLLWIMADDMGVGEPSFLASDPSGPRVIHTPHLDKLAASGMYFTAAYAGYTVCAPSRATFFTGRNSGRLAGAPADWPLLPRLLKDAGYQTAAFGKSAPMDDTTPGTLAWGLPTEFGFERYTGQPDQGLCHNMYPLSLTNDTLPLPLPLNDKEKSRELCMARPDQYNYTTDAFTDAALGWLHAERVPAKPFFLYVSYTVPHAGGWGSAPQEPEQGNPVPSELQVAVAERSAECRGVPWSALECHEVPSECCLSADACPQYSSESWPDVERDHAASVSYLDGKVR